MSKYPAGRGSGRDLEFYRNLKWVDRLSDVYSLSSDLKLKEEIHYSPATSTLKWPYCQSPLDFQAESIGQADKLLAVYS